MGFNTDSTFGPDELYLSGRAGFKFDCYERRINDDLKNSDFMSSAYRSHYSKMSRLTLSLAGQFHILNCLYKNSEVTSEITEENMKNCF